MALCNGGRSKDLAAVSQVKCYVKYAQSTHKRCTHRLQWTYTKRRRAFSEESVRELYERCPYERKFMSEVIENHATSKLVFTNEASIYE